MNTLFALSMKSFFCPIGLAAVIIILIPNFFFAKAKNQAVLTDVDTCSLTMCRLEIFCRVMLTLFLVFMEMPHQHFGFGIATGVVLLVYFALWIAYFKNGCYYPDMYMKDLLFIPVPMAYCRSLYFIFLSVWLGNGVALILSVIYAICHTSNFMAGREDLKARKVV